MTFTRVVVWILFLGVVACGTESPTMVVVDNDYPTIPDGGDPTTQLTVFKVWWATSLLPDPVVPGGEGQAQRAVPNTDFAYALLAAGWDPSSSTPPSRLVAAKSAAKLSVVRGDTLHVRVSDGTFVGNCAAGKALSQDDANFIARSIFPSELSGVAYDASTCAATPLPAATSPDASGDGTNADAGASAAD